MPARNRHYTIYLGGVGLLLTLLSFSLFGSPGDYGNYYYGSRFLLEGKSLKDIYDPWTFNLLVDATGQKGTYLDYTPVPPFSLVFYTPFTLVSIGWSKVFFNLAGSLVLLFGLRKTWQQLSVAAGFVIPALIGLLAVLNWENGQSYLLLSGLLLLGWNQYAERKYWIAALLWAVCIHLKVSPAIIFLFLLFESDWKMIFRLAALCLAFCVVTIPFTGWETWQTYFTEILPRLSVNEINDPYAFNSQSVTTFLRRLLVHDDLLNPANSIYAPFAFSILNSAVVSLFLLAGGLVSLAAVSRFSKFCFWIGLLLVVSGYTALYAMIFLLFPVMAMIEAGKWNSRNRIIAGLLFLPVFLPVIQVSGLHFVPLIGILLLLGFTLVQLRPRLCFHPAMLVVLLLPLSRLLFYEAPDSSCYLQQVSSVLLTGDYEWRNDTLLLQTRTGRGLLPEQLYLEGAAAPDPQVQLKKNQLFYKGKQLTFSRDRKKKPMLATDGSIVYLSDKNRGVGFYTLRKIPLKP
jgi:hypothetical protein